LFVGQNPQRFHCRFVVVQGLAHAHEDDVEAGVEHAELARQYANLARDFTCGQIAIDPHLAGQAECALHRASDLGGHAERLSRCIGDVDRFDVPAVGEPEEELRRAVFRTLLALDDGGRDRPRGRELRAKVAAEVAHQRKVRHAALVHPLEDLAGVKARAAQCLEGVLELVQLDFRDVESGVGEHGGRRRRSWFRRRTLIVLCRSSAAAAQSWP
jgi:hypothetical protein